MRRPLLLLGMVAASLAPLGGVAHACDFTMGFKALHDTLPGTIGDCLTDEQHDGATGDGLQRTTGGLLVWRRADNTPAFTDGYNTWLMGPRGLEHRLADERLPWESSIPAAPPPVATEPIYLNGVVLSEFRTGRDDPRYGAGLPYLLFTIENRFSAPVRVTDTRLEYSAVFVDPSGSVRYPSSLAAIDPLPPEGLLPGERVQVLLYALVPSRAGVAPTAVELYHGRGLERGRELLRTLPLG